MVASSKSVVGARVAGWAVLLGVALLLAAGAAPSDAALPGKNGRIAFTEIIGDDTSNAELQTIRPSGKGLRSISSQGYSPAFSPRGRRLVYSAWYDSGLWVRAADGRGPAHRLTRQFDYAPDWSANGRRIVFTREGPLRPGDASPLQVRIYAGGGSRRLAVGGDPAWSVGREIAFVGADGIFVIRPNGSGQRLIVRGGSQPDWSPDGRRLVFVRGGHITIATANGSIVRRLGRGTEPTFSPDGRMLAYITTPGNLATMSVRGKRRDIIARPWDMELEGPDWQPLPIR